MVNVVARLEAFAGMSRMKRLALVVLCHTVTDKHLTRLKVRCPAVLGLPFHSLHAGLCSTVRARTLRL
jgi:hypothetical protein